MRPLYSTALGAREFSAFFGTAFSGAGSTAFGSATASPAPDAGSLELCEASLELEFAAEWSEAASVAGPAEVAERDSLTWALCKARAASKTGLILFAP